MTDFGAKGGIVTAPEACKFADDRRGSALLRFAVASLGIKVRHILPFARI
ncbi:MAG: hypothetical protein IJ127_21480 [Afipia sp.]|nr:hypothetical protein [Afipia sp.]MBS4006426.1 hypothetical protein [Afipia sp.]WIG53427.1 MAG: hypothetical protein OJF48_004347 [Afipia sp.]